MTTRFAIAIAAATVLFTPPARAQFIWSNGAGGNWSVPANWGGTGPTAGGGTEVTLTFGPAGTYTATNDLAGIFNLNALNFNHASGTITIAPSGGSSLNFLNTAAAVGPTINMQGAGNAIISSPVSFANNTTVSGAGGAGSLTLSGVLTGGLNNLTTTSVGGLTVSGGGDLNKLIFQNGNNFITGGTLALTSPTGAGNVDAGLEISGQSGGSATTTISGATTIVNVTENIYLGNTAGSTGTSTLIVRDGATVNNPSATSGRFGVGNGGGNTSLQILNGGVVNTNMLFVARIAGSGTNTVLVDGVGSRITANVQLSFGTAGAGSMIVQNGGVAESPGSVNIGRANTAGVSGSVTVTGTGSTLNAGTAASTAGPQLNVGLAGPGSLTVSNNAVVNCGTGTFAGQLVVGFFQTTAGQGTVLIQSGGRLNMIGNSFIGTNPGSTGDITVTGTGSQWNQEGQFSMQNGPSTVTVSAGGAFNVTGTGIPFLGTVAGQSATLTVTGAGSTFVTPGQFTISGGGGTGGGNVTVNVTSGGAVSSGLTILGQDAAAGSANVTVDGGTFTTSGQFQVAPPDAGGNSTVTSTVNVQGGGSLTVNSSAFFGIGVGSTSNLNVTGASSVMETTGTGQIQFGGSGTTAGGTTTVNIGTGGTVRTSADPAALVAIFAPATVNVNSGGTLQSPNIGVSGRLIANGAVNGAVDVATGGFLGGTSGISGSIGTITGNVDVNSGATLRPGDGTPTGAGILTVAGTGNVVTIASGGTFSVNVNGPTPGNGPTNHAQLVLTGGATIDITGSTLQTTLGYAPAPGQVITIINGGAVTGTFNGLPDNQLFQVGTFSGTDYFANIRYTANTVFFQVVPEPLHVLGLGALVCGGFTWLRKRRKANPTLAA